MSFDIKFSAKTEYTWAVDCHPTQPWLITSHVLGNVQVHNFESGKIIHSFSLNPASVWCVKFIPCKDWYVVGSDDGNLHIFNCVTHTKVVTLAAHTKAVGCLAVHPTVPLVLTGSYDKTIKAWHFENENWGSIQTYQDHTNRISSITFNPHKLNTFASAGEDHTVKIWSIGSPIPDFTIKAHSDLVRYVDFYPSSHKPYLLTASNDRTVKVWDYRSQKCVKTMKGHTDRVIFAVFHPSLPIIISGACDGSIQIWNRKTYEIERTLTYGLGDVRCISIRGGTSEVALGFEKGVLTIDLGSLQIPAMRGDARVEADKEKSRDMKEPAINTTTHAQRKLQPTQSLDDLTTAYDTALSLSMPSTTPSHPHSVHQHKTDPYQQCIILSIELMAAKTTNKLISELTDDKAQYMADFLSKMISEEQNFPLHERKRSLHLLSKLAKSAEVFPQSLELEGVQCDLLTLFAAGGYGFIYKGEYQERSVCIKAVHIDYEGIDRKKLRAHASELTIWAHIDHPNILPFLGIYPSKEAVPRICIVSPWMVNGDLLRYLGQVPDAPRKPLVRDIISGLQYLHDLDIIHADLKAKNVLVSATGKAMLADFGISRLSITLTTILTNAGTGSAYWMAPELQLDDHPRPTRETDIWAFACTCYEIITRAIPFGQYHNPAILVGAFFRGKIIPEKPEKPGIGWDEDVWSVAMRCWQRDPASRPRARELLDMIDSFNFLDNRPSSPESKKDRSYAEIDYDRILGILNEIRESAST